MSEKFLVCLTKAHCFSRWVGRCTTPAVTSLCDWIKSTWWISPEGQWRIATAWRRSGYTLAARTAKAPNICSTDRPSLERCVRHHSKSWVPLQMKDDSFRRLSQMFHIPAYLKRFISNFQKSLNSQTMATSLISTGRKLSPGWQSSILLRGTSLQITACHRAETLKEERKVWGCAGKQLASPSFDCSTISWVSHAAAIQHHCFMKSKFVWQQNNCSLDRQIYYN